MTSLGPAGIKAKTRITANRSPTKTFYPAPLNSEYHYNHVSYKKNMNSASYMLYGAENPAASLLLIF